MITVPRQRGGACRQTQGTSMKRTLTLAMLLSLTTASPMALALGLGEAEVHSTLNAPLRASLPLSDSGGIQAGLLNVSVADDRAYAAAGLTRTPIAASVRLAVEQQQGRLVVNLTTERPVREPWLDLLLRFDWPDGQQLREVTLLLDPPDYDQMPSLVAGSARTPRQAPSASAPPPGEASPSSVVARPVQAQADSDPARVQSGDTLWAIAGRLRPDSGISMNQMMVALVEANPEVFPSGNINAMRAGFTLVVPNRNAIAGRSSADADRIVAAMNQAWANRGGGAPARVALGDPQPAETTTSVATAPDGSTPSPEPAAAEDSPPVAEAEAPGSDPAEPAEGPRLTLLTDAELAAEGGGESVADQPGSAPQGETGDLADSSEGGILLASQVSVDPALLEALHGEGELTGDDRLLRMEARWLESQQALEAVQEERGQLQDELGEMREELAALRDQLALLSAGGSGVDGPGAGGVVAPGSDAEDSPWWGAFYQGEVDRHLMLGGAGLAALLALWLVVRRRQRREDAGVTGGFGEVRVGAPGAEGPVSPHTAAVAGAAAQAPAMPVQSSMPQAEAINEADIFIAYGRYDQARDLLETSLAREPERDDLRLKLLNVHLEQGNREEAASEAARLREGGNPAVADEVERLMDRHGLAEAPRPSSSGGRAVFAESAELPPRVFDTPSDELADVNSDTPPDTDEAAPTVAADQPREGRDGDRSSEALSNRGDTTPVDHDPLADAEERATAEVPEPMTPPEPEPPESSGQTPVGGSPEAAEQESKLPPLVTRQDHDGREIIDYAPPSLDVDPAPRKETPMQPSVDFTSGSPAEGEPGADSESSGALSEEKETDTLPEEWEVEEVAFPPRDRDNVGFSPGASPDRLVEARRLAEVGEVTRARELLDDLRTSDDPAIRDEASALLSRLDA